MSDTKTVQCVVACRNSNGSPSFFPCTVTVTEEQYDLGMHYTVAEGYADAEGFEGPMLVYERADCPPFLLDHYFPETSKVRDAIKAVLACSWHEELEDAQTQLNEEEDISDHLFSHLVTLDNFVDGLDRTPLSYLDQEGGEEEEENDNCLRGVKCPKCGQTDSFMIEGTDDTGTRTLEMHDDGCDADGDFEYDETAPCACTECDGKGTVGEATN